MSDDLWEEYMRQVQRSYRKTHPVDLNQILNILKNPQPMKPTEPCSTCNGTGWTPSDWTADSIQCEDCDGVGQMPRKPR